MRRALPLLMLALPTLAHADWPVGQPFDEAVLVDVTPEGFDALEDTLPAVVPSSIPLDDIHDGASIVDAGVVELLYDLYVTNLEVGANIVDIDLSPGDGVLWLDAALEVNLNDSSNQGNIEVILTEDWFWGSTTRQTLIDCGLYVEPFVIDVSTWISMEYVPDGAGGRVLDVELGPLDWAWDITGDDIHATGCWIEDINDLLDIFGFNLFDLALALLEGQVDGLVDGLTDGLDETIEDAVNGIAIEEEVALGEAVVTLGVAPSNISITPDGMRIAAMGFAETEPHPCIVENGIDQSLATFSSAPSLGSAPSEVPLPYHAGILADDDFLNSVLFSVYYGGGLCFRLSGADSPDLPLSTALLSALEPGGTFGELFPEDQDVIISTRPRQPPVAYADGDSDVNVEVKELELDFYAELDYRNALIVGLDLDADAGVNLPFDGTTGSLGVEVLLTGDDVDATTRHNEFAPGFDEAIAGNVKGLFDGLVGSLLGGLLGDVGFAIPAFGEKGISSITVAPSGGAKDWFGFYANLDTVPYGSPDGCAGCSDDGSGGCGGDSGGGCEGGGCSGVGLPARGVLLLLPFLGALIRRRR